MVLTTPALLLSFLISFMAEGYIQTQDTKYSINSVITYVCFQNHKNNGFSSVVRFEAIFLIKVQIKYVSPLGL